jgi:hypothetical protein
MRRCQNWHPLGFRHKCTFITNALFMTNAHSSQMRFHPKWAFITNQRSPVTDPGPTTPQNNGIAQTRPVRARLGIASFLKTDPN